MNRSRAAAVFALGRLWVLASALAVAGTTAELYFSADSDGATRVTSIQEGESVWIVVYDPDENIDCDVRDKFWTDVKLMDPKTGANVDWQSMETCAAKKPYDYIGRDGCTSNGHFFEETDADTGLFVSNVPFQIGRRIDWNLERGNGHWVGSDFDGYDLGGVFFNDFLGDAYYWGDERDFYDIPIDPDYAPFVGAYYGWFENMDTLVGLYQDPNDVSDVAIAMMKIVDTEATISWSREVYPDGNEAATITIVDPDENLSCSHAEVVPVFVLVNPGSWNPKRPDSATSFCMLWRVGGVWNLAGNVWGDGIWGWNIYDSGIPMIDLAGDGSHQPNAEGTWYIDYPTKSDGNVVAFDTASDSGVTRAMFYARETGVDTGVFELRLNNILFDLGFDSLDVGDVLAAYYLDPNDFDDFKVATASIERKPASVVRFTDAGGSPQSAYWIGHDPVYVQVVDANANVDACCPERVLVHLCSPHEEDDSEWWILDEQGSNSSVFFTHYGVELAPVWNPLGTSSIGALGGYQLVLDNWKLETFNEDDVLVRYNDVVYEEDEIPFVGDGNDWTAFPPEIDHVRVANNVSFAMMTVGDTQVYDGDTTTMYFLDRNGNRIGGYAASDCVFVEVVDPDQDEDPLRRERIDGYWADVENAWPFAPEALYGWDCGAEEGDDEHWVNDHLGTVSIFNTLEGPKIYVLNPRNGRWAAVDLLESGVGTADFVSAICIDLTGVYDCAPTLGALPGDMILAVYQDPSNHSDSAWISIQVGIGGSTSNLQSTTAFVDADGNEVSSYSVDDDVYVKVVDPSHVGAPWLADAIEIDGVRYDLTLWYDSQTFAAEGTFITEALDLDLAACVSITATYTDPADPTDTSSDTVPVTAAALHIDGFVVAPNPFATTAAFSYEGTGIAKLLSVEVYDLAGHRVWSMEETNVRSIAWNGTDAQGRSVANGGYIYVVTASDGTETFTGRGIVFVNR